MVLKCVGPGHALQSRGAGPVGGRQAAVLRLLVPLNQAAGDMQPPGKLWPPQAAGQRGSDGQGSLGACWRHP